eukprot:9051888-Alexandrium_andersonii.AAC.1
MVTTIGWMSNVRGGWRTDNRRHKSSVRSDSPCSHCPRRLPCETQSQSSSTSTASAMGREGDSRNVQKGFCTPVKEAKIQVRTDPPTVRLNALPAMAYMFTGPTASQRGRACECNGHVWSSSVLDV